jgi:hypothetical protein
MTDDNEQSHFEHLDNNFAKAKKCLNRPAECLKTDLKLEPGLLARVLG